MSIYGPGDIGFFDRVAGLYDRVMPTVRPADIEAAFAFAHRPIEDVLDVAGGTGRASRAIQAETQALVLDLSTAMLSRAREDGLQVIRGDAHALPVHDERMDAALIVDALHHMPRPERALEAVSDILAPGGVLVVREFDPETRRGRALAATERLIGMNSQFMSPSVVMSFMSNVGLRPWVVDPGFGYTVVGVKPSD